MKQNQRSTIKDFFRKKQKVDDVENEDLSDNFVVDADSSSANPPGSCKGPADEVSIVVNTDLQFYQGSKLNDFEKQEAILRLQNPNPAFKYPPILKGDKKLRFNNYWLEDFHWFHYSKSANGVFCKFCFFFAYGDQISSILVKTPFNNWRISREAFENHARTFYHKLSVERASTFEKIVQNPDSSIERQLSKQKDFERKTNLNLLKIFLLLKSQ